VISKYKEGYARRLWDLGYAATSAVHCKESKLVAVLERLDGEIAALRGGLDWANAEACVRLLLLERDATAICGLWDSYMRGVSMGRLRVQDVQDSEGHSLYPRLVTVEGIVVPGFRYQLALNGSKTIRRARAGVVELQVRPPGEESLCFLRRLQRYSLDMGLAHMSPSIFLFRPTTADHMGFKDAAASSGALNQRFKQHLQRCGLYAGETLHGVRRGTMQAAHQAGASVDTVGATALQVTSAVTRMYLDTSRETGGPQRRRRSRVGNTAGPL